MKKLILLTALFLGLFATAQAQVGKGLFAGGSLGFSMAGNKSQNGSNTTQGTTSSSFNVTPRIGYFFTDNIAAGLVLGYAGTTINTPGFVDSKTTAGTLSVGLFGRYALPLGDGGNFAFLGDLNLGFSSTTGKTELGSVSIESDPSTNVRIGIAPGILFFPTPKIGLEAGLGNIIALNTTTVTSASNSDIKTIGTTVDILNISTMGFILV
jgi:outer membrane protein